MKKILLTLFLLLATSTCIFAQQLFQLQFPVKCQLNKNCWIINYVDNDSTTEWHDYRHGRQTYDGHTGTDIAIKNLTAMKQGVDVLATTSGFVIATRDGVPDKNALNPTTSPTSGTTATTLNKNTLQNMSCGNRVAIKHAGGWITDYCHMKSGSIKVKKGDFVMAGQKIGQIGLSGTTEFPHLHLNVQNENLFFDPFTGHERYLKGVRMPLWTPKTAQELTYTPTVVYNTGISDEIPTLLNIRNEKYKNTRISFFSNMMLVWVDMFHVERGDTLNILVKDPKGNPLIKKDIVIEKSNAKKFIYTGKRKPVNGFAKGNYTVKISFERPGKNMNYNQTFTFSVN